MIMDFFTALSTFDGRSGSAFKVNVKEITWSKTISDYLASNLPMFDIAWLADFADADDFARAYMHCSGAFAYYQGYTAANGWGTLKDQLVDKAMMTPDGPVRQALYQQLQQIYYNDCPSFPLGNPRGRYFCQYWVKGWYYNPMYPSPYYYTMWKADDCWYDVSGSTVGVSDGVSAMRDIAYLIAHFNAKAPDTSKPLDPKWVGVYGANGCVDPYGDRVCNMKDIAGAVMHFGHRANTGTP